MIPWILSQPECVWPAGALLGEGPVWSERDHTLWWVDIKGLGLHRFEPASGRQTSWRTDEPIGCIDAPGVDGQLFAAGKSGFVWLAPDADGGHAPARRVLNPEADRPGNRFNDGKRAPDGSFWAGTMDDAEEDESGAWWRFDFQTGTTDRLDTGYRVTNGPAFDAARGRVYLTDSARQTVYVADWAPGQGIANKRVFLAFGEGEGYPDGMQTDPEGGLWIAFWDGACLRRFDPDAALVQTVHLPVRRPTSLAFAPEADLIFITSASISLEDAGPADGSLMALKRF